MNVALKPFGNIILIEATKKRKDIELAVHRAAQVDGLRFATKSK